MGMRAKRAQGTMYRRKYRDRLQEGSMESRA
jgi:hypothetical protein